MIEWYTWVQVGVAVVVGVLCIIIGLLGKVPGDFSVGALVLVELLLIGQFFVTIVQPFVGNNIVGDGLEFWTYLITAMLLPIGAIMWVFIDRTKWSTVVLGAAALSVAIMLWRMQVIWSGTSTIVQWGMPAWAS